MSIIKWGKRQVRHLIDKYQKQPIMAADSAWEKMQDHLRKAERIIDLGCGANPYHRASVAVDAFIEPLHRGFGMGKRIDQDILRERGVTFFNSDIADLPFIGDKSFDFAYSHHVFEHHPYPKKACLEMQRIAKAGAIITPSAFAEIAFGRPYHIWFVLARGNTLIFIRKRHEEYCPFGDHPIKFGNGYRIIDKTNPFDILLNDGGWYRGLDKYPRLSILLRRYWYAHSPVMETVFVWKDSFECVVIDEAGNVE